MVESRRHRHLLAEIARQIDDGDPRVRAVKLREQRDAAVAAAVVDVDDFGGAGNAGEHRAEPAMELRQHGFLVIDRDHDRQRSARLLRWRGARVAGFGSGHGRRFQNSHGRRGYPAGRGIVPLVQGTGAAYFR